jgi:hypothetical protein
MACYNSELPIGPQGPTGPQGPPGESGTCCIERLFNDNTTTALVEENNTQSYNFSLDADGEFVEFTFQAYNTPAEFVGFLLTLDTSTILIDVDGDPINNIKGTINVTRLNSTQINITMDVIFYGLTVEYGGKLVGSQILGVQESNPYYSNYNYTVDPTNVTLDLSAFITGTSTSSTLTVSKFLKYKLPYL